LFFFNYTWLLPNSLLDDNIDVQEDVIQKAKKGDAQAIYTIGCIYAAEENKEKTIVWLGTSSAMGYHKSQIEIGRMLESLDLYSYESAIQWYKQARNHGIISGYAHIGDIYRKKHDYSRAEEQYKIAADSNDPYGQTRLGLFYRDRYPDRYGVAFDYFNKSAEQNHPSGQYELAYMYENGRGTDVDKYKALVLYQKSKAGGYEPAGVRVDDLNKQGYFHIPQSTYYFLNDTYQHFLV
jgi:TPR repeat protein